MQLSTQLTADAKLVICPACTCLNITWNSRQLLQLRLVQIDHSRNT